MDDKIKNDMNNEEQSDMDWKEFLAYGCAISVGAVATLLVGASVGSLIVKGIRAVGVKRSAKIIADVSKML